MQYLVVDDEKLVRGAIVSELKKAVPEDSEIFDAENYIKALDIIRENDIYVAFLDINLPVVNGIELSKQIVEISPETNIVFATANSQYSVEAWETEASTFLLKPITKAAIEKAMEKLRKPRNHGAEKIKAQCFGNFECFYHNKPIAFSRSQSKEFLAYLIDRKGAEVGADEIRAVLWEEEEDSEAKKSYIRTLASDIRKSLREIGMEDALIHRKGNYSVNRECFECDYYDYIEGKLPGDSFTGEYMSRYSWAENTLATLV